MNKFIAIIHQDKLEIHAINPNGVFGTLCGLDGDDKETSQLPAQLPKNPKINCNYCIQLILTARQYKLSDLKK